MLWLLTGKLKLEVTIKDNEKTKIVNQDINANEGERETIFVDGSLSVSIMGIEQTKLMGTNFVAIKVNISDSIASNPEAPTRENISTFIVASKTGNGVVDIRNYSENRTGINKINNNLYYKKLGAARQSKLLREVVNSINSYLTEKLRGQPADGPH